MPTPTPIRATTQQHLDVLDISDNLVLLKDGSVAMILQTSAVNFDLLSEKEQEAVIFSYGQLLNSLTFPIQILIRSHRKDVSNYLNLLKTQEDKTAPGKRKRQISQYRSFISKIVKEGNVLDKKFYCIIPFSRLELGLTASNPLTIKKPQTLPYDKKYILDKATTTLNPKRDHLLRQFARIGLSAKQLKSHELTQLLYNVYNPGAKKAPAITDLDQYKAPLVQTISNQQENIKMNDSLSDTPAGDTSSPATPEPTTPTPTTPPPATPEPTTPTPTPPPPPPATPEPTTPTPTPPPPPATPAETPTDSAGDSGPGTSNAQEALNEATKTVESLPSNPSDNPKPTS